MFQLTDIMSEYLGNSWNKNKGQNPDGYINMLSTLYENESRKSGWGGASGIFRREFYAAKTVYDFPLKLGTSAALSVMGDPSPSVKKSKDVLSEIQQANNFSHLSDAGSDEYRQELMRNDDFLQEFDEEIRQQQ